jgi:raffinose/stachyose/melibiose transport system permease protein
MGFQLGRRSLLAVYAVLVTVPLLVVLYTSIKTQSEVFEAPFLPPADPTLDNYQTLFREKDLAVYFINSVIVTIFSVALTLFLASMTGFAVARLPGWQSGLLYTVFVLGMAVPAQANMIPQYEIFRQLGLLNSRIGLILINMVVTLPVAVFILGGFMKTLPREFYEAAVVDGAGLWRQYAQVVIPLSLPSLSATAIFLFVMHWNDLLYPLLFITRDDRKTLPLALLDFKGEFVTNYPLLFAGVVIASLPMVVAYVFLQRFFVAGMTAGSVKG